MAKQPIKSIVFDMGGVVMHGGYLDFIYHYVGRHLPESAKKKILSLERAATLGKISEREFYRLLTKEFAVHISPEKMHARIISRMSANKSLIKYIPHLKRAKIALFSNTIGHISADALANRKVPVKKIFDKLFLSSVMHLAKPTRASYRYVTRNLKVKPSQSLMVDDDKSNIAAAKKVGMKGLLFKNTRQFKRDLKQFELL